MILLQIRLLFLTVIITNYVTNGEMQDLTHLSEDEIKANLNPENDPLISLEVMNEIQGGTFLMGTDAPDANHGENPSKTISVRTFHLDRYPVTVAHFKAFLKKKRRYKVQTTQTGFSYVIAGLETKYVDKERGLFSFKYSFNTSRNYFVQKYFQGKLHLLLSGKLQGVSSSFNQFMLK